MDRPSGLVPMRACPGDALVETFTAASVTRLPFAVYARPRISDAGPSQRHTTKKPLLPSTPDSPIPGHSLPSVWSYSTSNCVISQLFEQASSSSSLPSSQASSPSTTPLLHTGPLPPPPTSPLELELG